MKSIEELYKEVQENEELKKEFITSFKEGQIESFLSSYDCDASVSDVMAFLSSIKEDAASEDDLAKVAGGGCSSYETYCGGIHQSACGADQLGFC